MAVKGLSKEDVKQYEEAFKTFDVNGDGRISCKELRTFLKSVGHNASDREVKQIMDRADQDKSGSIEFKEFLVLVGETLKQSEQNAQNTEYLRQAFREFDKDGNGVITVKEFKKAMAKVGRKYSEKEVKKMMKDVDQDGDGCINYYEFVEMMKNQSI